MLLKDKIAIITGAGQGIGRSIALSFASEGAVPVIADINEKKAWEVVDEIKNIGIDTIAVKVDVSKVDQIRELVGRTVEKFGTVDILVNNAGILHGTAIEDITEEEWDRMMDVNLKSVFFASQQVIPYMKKAGRGKIINMSSLAGRMGGYGNGVAYSASKSAIIGLSMALARRLAEFGINVNAVAPGTTESDIIKQFSQEKIEYLKSIIPLKRLGKPEEIANLVTFLASDKSDFITGAVVDINGGMFMG